MMVISELMQHLSVLYFLRQIQMSIWTHTYSSVLSSMKFIFLHLFRKNCSPFFKLDVGFFNFYYFVVYHVTASSNMQHCVCWLVRVRLTYRPSTALWLLGSLRISHKKFLQANKWVFILMLHMTSCIFTSQGYILLTVLGIAN